MAQKDQNDPFETHKKGGVFDSLWGRQPQKAEPKPLPPPPPEPPKSYFNSLWATKQPQKTEATPLVLAGGGKGYKADEKLPPPPSFARLVLIPCALFSAQAVSFTFFWELHKSIPITIAIINLCFVFDQSSLGDRKNSRGEDINGFLPALGGPNGARAMRVWLQITVAWLAVFMGGITGMNADETYMAQFYVIVFGREYENVLASTPAAAYADAGKLFFAKSSAIAGERSVGFKEKLVYCAAPLLDENQGGKPIAFWAIGFDCCDARGNFKCGAGTDHRGGVRVPPDGFFAKDRGMFLRAVNQSAAVNRLDVDEDPILLHWVKDPDSEAAIKFFQAFGAVLIGLGLFALLVLLMVGIGLSFENEYADRQMKNPPAQAAA